MSSEANAWRTGVLVAIGTVLMLGIGAAVANLATSPDEVQPERSRAPAVSGQRASAAPAAVVEDCNQYATQARRNTGRIVRDGAVGGAGVGAAGKKSEQAMTAYQQCMARRGYRG